MKKKIVDHNFPSPSEERADPGDVDPSEFMGSEYDQEKTATFSRKELKALGF